MTLPMKVNAKQRSNAKSLKPSGLAGSEGAGLVRRGRVLSVDDIAGKEIAIRSFVPSDLTAGDIEKNRVGVRDVSMKKQALTLDTLRVSRR